MFIDAYLGTNTPKRNNIVTFSILRNLSSMQKVSLIPKMILSIPEAPSFLRVPLIPIIYKRILIT